MFLMRSNSKTIKRAISPFDKKDLISDKKKRLSPYEKKIKQFESYGKIEKKKNTSFLKGSIQQGQDKKFRILTEPVDTRIMDLAKINIFENSLSRNNLDSRKKLQTESRESTKQIKLNLQKKTPSREKIHLSNVDKCPNCSRYLEQLEQLKKGMNKIINAKTMWKNGETTLTDLKDFFYISGEFGSPKKNEFKTAQTVISDVKKHFYDFMREIESLSFIDYPKMLSLDIFTYDHSYSEFADPHENELKELFTQLRSNMEGKITQYETEETLNDSTYTKQILRNLKSRLNYCLRENLQLRMKKAILERAQEISEQSEEYLRKVLESVLINYTVKGM